jgi:hypothetical protein
MAHSEKKSEWSQRMIGLPFTACPEPVEEFTVYLTLCALR